MKIGTQICAETIDCADFCAGQDEGEMTIFTAKMQRCKEAKKQGKVFFCLFAPLPLCSKSSTISLIITDCADFYPFHPSSSVFLFPS
jgi:hypothetical protein